MSRQFNRRALLSGAAAVVAGCAAPAAPPVPRVEKLPRWRGFNLMELFDPTKGPQDFQPFDFDTIAEWGFDFVRIPCSYWFWASSDPTQWTRIDEAVLARTLDAAVAMGRERRLHVSINMHRLPGYCVAPPVEAYDLWTDERALAAATAHWTHLAQRYRGIPSTELSFDLINEPSETVTAEQYNRVHLALIDAIRRVDPSRLIFADGMTYGLQPAPGLAGAGVAISTRGYKPFELSHYQAPWIGGAMEWPRPSWPMTISGQPLWDRDRYRREAIIPFQKVHGRGLGVHVGEWGAYGETPHDVVLAWMTDLLSLWREAGWGWSLWNLRGGFGVLDSNRHDVSYANFRGHDLDARMLELLKAG